MGLSVSLEVVEPTTIFSRSITHNLGRMASAAGLYQLLWCPDELGSGVSKARDLIAPLQEGLVLLRSDPERFKHFNSSNDWGVYDDFVAFVEAYLSACIANPHATIHVSR